MYDVEIFRIIEEKNVIGDVEFNLVLMLKFEDNYFKVFSGKDKEKQLYYSVVV
ncbi:MAG: hypothetical protein PHZ26_03115 [Candidatus Gracilibacteria bacterium]|nr:hypothetical protein [Candidatus Gracilibacteria bacterium]MDD2908718.1 hypothetical protein [Candidatus Gracilibacteria bacterium]